jgi:hypothetical protein
MQKGPFDARKHLIQMIVQLIWKSSQTPEPRRLRLDAQKLGFHHFNVCKHHVHRFWLFIIARAVENPYHIDRGTYNLLLRNIFDTITCMHKLWLFRNTWD